MNAQQRARLNELRVANAIRNNYELLKADEPMPRAVPVKAPSASTLTPEQRQRLDELRAKRGTTVTVAPAKGEPKSNMTPAQRARLDELRNKQQQRVSEGAHPMAAATERLNALRETENMGALDRINEMTRVMHDTAQQLHNDAHQNHVNLVDHQNHMNFMMMNQ